MRRRRAGPYPGRVDLIEGLPQPVARRLAVRVTPDALRRVRGGHPWVFDESIVSLSTGRADGEQGRGTKPGAGATTGIGATIGAGAMAGHLAVIFDDHRRFAAIGLYDPASPIRIKVLHRGQPRQINAAFWRERLTAAHDLRAELRRGGHTTGYRWVNGENDQLPGLVVDVYERVAVVKLYSAAWVPHLATVLPELMAIGDVDTVVLRTARAVRAHLRAPLTDGCTLVGEAPSGPVLFREHGLTFEADVVAGQKTGHFLDQRDNRALVRGLSSGRSVLDVFSATGGFAVHAAAGGATEVLSIDLSGPTLAVAERNIAHNLHLDAVRACAHRTMRADAFQALQRLADERRTFDVVVVDPPSFAQRQTDVNAALRAYERLAELAVQVVTRGGAVLLASCSSRVTTDEFVAAAHRGAQRAGRDLHIEQVTGHAVDHPIGFPEGAYLKAVLARPTVSAVTAGGRRPTGPVGPVPGDHRRRRRIV